MIDRAALANDVRQWGLRRAMARAAYSLARRGTRLRLYLLMALEAEEVIVDAAARELGLAGHFLDPDELRAHAAEAAGELPAAFVERASARGDLCYGVLAGDRLVNCGWYTNRSARAQGSLTVAFEPRYHYMYGGYTHPEFRGRGLLELNLARACTGLRERGSAGLVTIAERVNFAAIVASHRVGFRDCGLALAIPIAGRWSVWQTATRPPHRLRLHPMGGPLP